MCWNSGAADSKWLAFVFKFHPKSGLFLICILFWIRACLSQHFSVGPRAPADSIWSLELGGGGSQIETFSEWGVTAVKHLSGSLPPLLFKSRHAFAHKDTRRHMGMCCETFSGDIRRGNAVAAGNQHTNTHQHTHTQVPSGHLRISPTPQSSPLVIAVWVLPGQAPSCRTVRRK